MNTRLVSIGSVQSLIIAIVKSAFPPLPLQSVSNRLSATVADLLMVKKVVEETESRARAEKNLFEEQTSSFEQRIEQLSQRLDRLLKDYQVCSYRKVKVLWRIG